MPTSTLQFPAKSNNDLPLLADNPHQVALFGFGNVGSGFYQAFEDKPIPGWEIGPIVVRTPNKGRILPESRFSFSWEEALTAPGLEAVVEALNVAEPAYALIKTALSRGLHVISASKAVLARHLPELDALAKANGVKLLYEASTGGAIPILRLVRHHYAQERILSIKGILNGTSNYILTRMNEGIGYTEALAEAQALGFAETDPTADVDGFDAANKLAILTYLAFGQAINVDKITIRGIRSLPATTLAEARAEGRRARLIASVRVGIGGFVEAQVAPRLVSEGSAFYAVEREFNAIQVAAPFSGLQTFIGRGAGSHPTGSAVLSDLAEIAAWVGVG
jgi:homoserine dehydrogenase